MIRNIVFAILLTSFFCTGHAEGQQKFIDGVGDLPLMEGLQVLEGTLSQVDSPEGRVVVVEAAGYVPAAKVKEFYQGVLGNLGWQCAAENCFERDREKLSLTISEEGGESFVTFTLSPKS